MSAATFAAPPATKPALRDMLELVLGGRTRRASMSDAALLLALAELGGFDLACRVAERAGIRCSFTMAAIAQDLGVPDYRGSELGIH